MGDFIVQIKVNKAHQTFFSDIFNFVDGMISVPVWQLAFG